MTASDWPQSCSCRPEQTPAKNFLFCWNICHTAKTMARRLATTPIQSYFVGSGYVGARVDIRGTGQSEGQTPDREYSEQELQDGMEIIAWLARQPWSTGNIGMFGISWSGFNSLQLAMRHPPALKAVISTCSTEQLFH